MICTEESINVNSTIPTMTPSWDSIAVHQLQEADLLQHEVPDDHGKNPSRRGNPGTLEGDIVPGDITFYRLQSTADNKLRAYIAQGEVLPVATRSFGGIGIFAIPEMGRFYRHVLIEKNFPHHGAVAFGHFGKALYEVFKYIGVPVEDLNFNQPKGMLYPTENPFA